MSLFRLPAFCGLFVLVPALAYAEGLAPMVLNGYSAPPKLASSEVVDEHGRLVGHVEKVLTDQDGKPSALSLKPVGGGPVVVVSASAVSYDGRNLITTSELPQIAAILARQLRTANKTASK
jgi:hypothetical protein